MVRPSSPFPGEAPELGLAGAMLWGGGAHTASIPAAAHHGPTMWAGTNSGSVFAYALEVPSQEKFSERAVEAVLGKEIQLMHRAPVVAIAVLDGRGNPLPEPYEVSRDLAKAPDMQGSHSMLISSEEQFKVSVGLSVLLQQGWDPPPTICPMPSLGVPITLGAGMGLEVSGQGHSYACPWGGGSEGKVLPFVKGFHGGRLFECPLKPHRFLFPPGSSCPPPGLHAAQSERQDQVQADSTRGLPGTEGGPGELGQCRLRGEAGELPGLSHQPG